MFCNMFNFTIVFSILVTSLQMLSSAQRLIYLYEQETQKANFGKFSAAFYWYKGFNSVCLSVPIITKNAFSSVLEGTN